MCFCSVLDRVGVFYSVLSSPVCDFHPKHGLKQCFRCGTAVGWVRANNFPADSACNLASLHLQIYFDGSVALAFASANICC